MFDLTLSPKSDLQVGGEPGAAGRACWTAGPAGAGWGACACVYRGMSMPVVHSHGQTMCTVWF